MIIGAVAALLGAAAASDGAASSAGLARPAPARPRVAFERALWSSARGSIWVVRCTRGDGDLDHCAGLEARRGVQRRMLGQEYQPIATGLLWTRAKGVAGPDAVVFGSRGGTDGCVDVVAVSMASDDMHVQKLTSCRTDEPPVAVRRGRAAVDLGMPSGGLAVGGSNASTATVFIPAVWSGRKFQVDLVELKARSRGPDDDQLRRTALYWSLDGSTDSRTGRVSGDTLQPAVQALAGLMLYGRADQARVLLDAEWPTPPTDALSSAFRAAPGKAEFWRTLCGAALRNPLWNALGMDRIPHADLVRAGASGG